ncbi:MAG: bifunctional (p)ppGpp synthetase/guanosine-3',5'-bis(diphosphate) 3'-pyrophosphohydrolase [Pseudomonadales bacterium]|nr:bifunctional (p)ppGpp synthetase/guanosine-3',5'-bis(diphosphate) 3'-pyrophosphohydrolase [Pseudomonadales bacterium]
MVKVRSDLARLPDGSIDLDGWVRELVAAHRQLESEALRAACALVASLEQTEEALLESGLEFAELVASLELDTASVVSGLVYRAVRSGALHRALVRERFGRDVDHLLEEVSRMGATSLLEMSNARLQTSERRDQIENVRRMLVAMIDDARVAVLKLAERIVALRSAKRGSEARRQRIAREAHLVFAPLANRLGIWQLKWELEDLALRYLAPDIYISIARQLDGRREERERQVADIAAELEGRLRGQGIPALVTGRAKHIYSIWRKMQSKHIGIDQVYDVRAVRVLVDDIAQCYATLGVIHTQWRHVPSEFDDYIAAPKENGYRSIHTAVLCPDGLTLEVQIRTHEMHREAELGVCAHWSYKDGQSEDRPYAEKMNWLRQVVERRQANEQINPLAASTEFSDELRQLFRSERIFVYTPKGHVVDLNANSTPLDFAYRVHTAVGHRCRGALVDGEPVRLNTELVTGQRVEILTGAEQAPDRDWLDLHLGYVRTARARQKLHDWFRGRPADVNEAAGRARVATLLARLALPAPGPQTWSAVAARLGFGSIEEVFRALGAADCQVLDVVELIVEESGAASLRAVDDGSGMGEGPVRIELEAPDRHGLLRDIIGVLGDLGIPLLANSGRVDGETGRAVITLEVPRVGARPIACLVDSLCHIEDVLDARCVVPE